MYVTIRALNFFSNLKSSHVEIPHQTCVTTHRKVKRLKNKQKEEKRNQREREELNLTVELLSYNTTVTVTLTVLIS